MEAKRLKQGPGGVDVAVQVEAVPKILDLLDLEALWRPYAKCKRFRRDGTFKRKWTRSSGNG